MQVTGADVSSFCETDVELESDVKSSFPKAPTNLNVESITSNLKNLLGSKKNGDWINFVEEMLRLCPFLPGRGRSKQSDIKLSIIGLSGCNTFEEYLQDILNWNYAGWSKWQQAYNLVSKFPYLRYTNDSASVINTTYYKLGERFPKTIEEWKLYRNSKKFKKVKHNPNNKDILETIETELKKLLGGIEHLIQANNNDRPILNLLYNKIHKTDSDMKDLIYKVDRLTNKVDTFISEKV